VAHIQYIQKVLLKHHNKLRLLGNEVTFYKIYSNYVQCLVPHVGLEES